MQPLENKLKFYLPFSSPIRYGYRHGQMTYYNTPHRGDDFILPRGENIYQTCLTVDSAKIIYANNNYNFGKQMMIDYGQIDGHSVQSYMTHFLDFNVRGGQIIKRGGLLGPINKTGKWSGNIDHLHWSIKIDGKHYSPVPYLITNPLHMKYERIKQKTIDKFNGVKEDAAYAFIGIKDDKPVRCIIRKTSSGEIIEKVDVSVEEYIGAMSVWD